MKLTDIILEESQLGDKLAMGIYKAIDNIDPNLNYKDFASAVATVIKNEYGSHIIEPFMKELHSHLGLEETVNDKPKINISSVEGTGKLYSITINGVKQRGEDEAKAIQMVKKITGIELSHRESFDEDKVISALRNAGYDAEHSEMDVS